MFVFNLLKQMPVMMRKSTTTEREQKRATQRKTFGVQDINGDIILGKTNSPSMDAVIIQEAILGVTGKNDSSTPNMDAKMGDAPRPTRAEPE